mgnify:CR=1 FL=1
MHANGLSKEMKIFLQRFAVLPELIISLKIKYQNSYVKYNIVVSTKEKLNIN